MLDVIVLIAMAVTAAAFAVGLIVQSGIAQIPALIAAGALYLVMAASYLMVARAGRPSTGASGDRLNEVESALEIIDKDLQRIDRIEDSVSRLDMLGDRVERLDQALSEYAATAPIGGLGRSDHFSQELDEVHAKIDAVRADLEGDARNQRDKIAGDLRVLESLIKQLSRELIAASSGEPAVASAPAFEPVPPPTRPEPVISRAPEPVVLKRDPEPVVQKIEFDDELEEEFAEPEPATELAAIEEEALVVIEEQAAEAFDAPEPPAAEEVIVETAIAPRIGDNEMLELVSQGIEAGRVDLYLQPIVTLPERRPRFFEALTRIRTRSDELVLPASYLPVAEASGMMPLIDNVLLVKSVQTLRRLGPDSRIKGVFCNISVRTLLDPEFFPELVEFMEENSGLSESLIFELGQSALLSLNPDEMGALDTLGALGYGFSLDHVGDLDVDFAGLRDRFFRYVKIDAKTFLHGLQAKGSPYTAGEMKRALDDFDLSLIVEKVEDETAVAKLLDYGIELAQGHLFGKPKPMSPALFRELEGADAA
jgi:cyclic-di-GMP phosphodiesterase TipF (flagellum assembly factor)